MLSGFTCRWQQQWGEAKQALHGRDGKLAEVAESIEKGLILLGCTAIEDKLQEGVPECIERLAAAGIRIWVITGHKQVPTHAAVARGPTARVGYSVRILRLPSSD